MGWFSKKKAPQMRVPSAEELYGQALGWARGAMPYTTGARESAAQYLTTQPFDRRIDYASYQPTSMDEVLTNQYFANVWPEMQKTVAHGLSLSGMSSSPMLGAQLGKARGQIGFDIGQYLSELGQRRAETDEMSRRFNVSSALGIDPMNMISPFVSTAQEQAQQQSIADMLNYQNEAAGGGGGNIGALIGMGLGAIAAPFTGGLSLLPAMAMGGSLGGTVGSMFGGSNPIDIQTALQLMSAFPGTSRTTSPVNVGNATNQWANMMGNQFSSGNTYGNRLQGYIPPDFSTNPLFRRQ